MPTLIRFTCQHCHRTLKVSDDKAGRRGKCPKCGGMVTVPSSTPDSPHAGQPPAEQDDPLGGIMIYDFDDDAALVYPTPHEPPGTAEIDHRKVAVPRSVFYFQAALLAVVAVGAFALGIQVGYQAATEKTQQDAPAVPAVLSGRVVYRDQNNRLLPDAGAVVIIVPRDAKPEQQAGPQGLRPDDQPPDENHPGLWTIREIGGDYDRADSTGNYRLRVKSARSYYLLVISKNTRRAADEPVDKSHLVEIGRYFLPARDLLGDWQYRWQTWTVRQPQETVDDIVFDQR